MLRQSKKTYTGWSYDWEGSLYYASDYFPQLYDLAVRLIKEGKAYVDEQTSEQIAAQKGTPTTPEQTALIVTAR